MFLNQLKQSIKSKYQILNILIKPELLTKEQLKNLLHQDLQQTEILIFKIDRLLLNEKQLPWITLHKEGIEVIIQTLLIFKIYLHLRLSIKSPWWAHQHQFFHHYIHQFHPQTLNKLKYFYNKTKFFLYIWMKKCSE